MTSTLMGLVLIATVLVPGHVFRRFQARFLVLPTPTLPNEHLLGLTITGLWNLALTWPLLSGVGIDPLGALLAAQDMPSLTRAIHEYGLAWLLQILVAPAMWAVFSAYIIRKGWIQNGLSFAGIVPQPQYAQAFDAAFYAHRDAPALVSVTLKNGTILHGAWDYSSAASSSPGERDIFLSSVYVLSDDDGDLVQEETLSGILIRGTEVAYVTFAECDGEEEDEEEEIANE